MSATIVLCILSTMTFCLCLRAIIGLLNSRLQPSVIVGSSFSMTARRIARGYLMVATTVLALLALVGSVHYYLELFHFSL